MAHPRKPAIVVADDEEDIRTLLRDLLTPHGYRILEARTGWELLETVQVERPSLIILDLRMPGIDGLRAAEEIRKCPHVRDVPVVVLSAAAEAHTPRLHELGIRRILSKPFACVDVLEAVQAALQPRRRLN